MAMTIGVDIEDISRFENMTDNTLARIFTPLEIDYCSKFSNPAPHYTARFCAKEAVIKALTPIGINIAEYNKIEIYNTTEKYPKVRLLKTIDKNLDIEISISHDKTKAIAFANITIQ